MYFTGNRRRTPTRTAGDGGPAVKAKLNNPSGIAFDSVGNLYIAEFVNNRVRRVDATTGILTTIAGNGLPKRIDVLAFNDIDRGSEGALIHSLRF